MAHAYPARNGRALADPVRLAVWFAAGFLSVLIFHQGFLALLHAAGMIANAPYSMQPTHPLGVPKLWSLAFWGGVWAIVLAWVEPRFPRGGAWWVLAFLFGAVCPTLVGWFIVLPLKGIPVTVGWHATRIAIGLSVNGIWGLGSAVLFRLAATVLPGLR